MTPVKNNLQFAGKTNQQHYSWNGPEKSISFDEEGIQKKLLNLPQPCYLIKTQEQFGASNEGRLENIVDNGQTRPKVLAFVPPLTIEQMGSDEFRKSYGVKYAYFAGSMAHGISSEKLVIALGQAGFLASFGSGGIVPSELEETIQRIQTALPDGPYAFNLIHNPFEPAMESNAVDLYLKYKITTVEASAYMSLTPFVVRYRVAGLDYNASHEIETGNKIIAKVSRREVARQFMDPAPEKIIAQLLQQGLITETQAELSKEVPMADDVTVEADSGGHTDNRPLVSLLPSLLALRNEIQEKYKYQKPIRIGAAGGIGTPESTLAAYMMGADYIVTGSINQSCVEAGTSQHVKKLLAQVDMADVTMAPAFDMFEMGGKLQVVKRGTMFAMRAQKLSDLYRSYQSIEEIPTQERDKLEKQVFRDKLDNIWEETVSYFNQRDPEQIKKAMANPRKKMALIFRWYLGQASHWANSGTNGREIDYQVWCGPAMGAFNDWVRGSYLENPEQRKVTDLAHHLMTGAAYLYRLQHLKMHQIKLPAYFNQYVPQPR